MNSAIRQAVARRALFLLVSWIIIASCIAPLCDVLAKHHTSQPKASHPTIPQKSSRNITRLWKYLRSLTRRRKSDPDELCRLALSSDLLRKSLSRHTKATISTPSQHKEYSKSKESDGLFAGITNFAFDSFNSFTAMFLKNYVQGILVDRTAYLLNEAKRIIPTVIEEGPFQPLIDKIFKFDRRKHNAQLHQVADSSAAPSNRIKKKSTFYVMLNTIFPLKSMLASTKQDIIGKFEDALADELRPLIDKTFDTIQTQVVDSIVCFITLQLTAGNTLPPCSARTMFNGGLTPLPTLNKWGRKSASKVDRYHGRYSDKCEALERIDDAKAKVWLDEPLLFPAAAATPLPTDTPLRVLKLRPDSWVYWPAWFKAYFHQWSDAAIENAMFEMRSALRQVIQQAFSNVLKIFSWDSIHSILKAVLGRRRSPNDGALSRAVNSKLQVIVAPYLRRLMRLAEQYFLVQMYHGMTTWLYAFGEIPIPHNIVFPPPLQTMYDQQLLKQVEEQRKAPEAANEGFWNEVYKFIPAVF